jgi:hypothetical protein
MHQRRFQDISENILRINYFSQDIPPLSQLSSSLHRNGINVRFIGYIRKYYMDKEDCKEISNVLLVEMLARTLKNILWNQMREFKQENDEEFSKMVVDFVNDVFFKGYIFLLYHSMTFVILLLATKNFGPRK